MQKTRIAIIRINVLLGLMEGILVFRHYIRIPSESQSAILWGYSVVRLGLLAVIGLTLILLFYTFIQIATNRAWINSIEEYLRIVLEMTQTFWALFFTLFCIYLILFLSDHQLGSLASYRESSRSLLLWFGFVSLQLFTSFLLVRAYEADLWQEYRHVLIPTGIALFFITGLVCFIATTRIGLTPVNGYWQDAGVPIMFSQVVTACFLGSLLYFFVGAKPMFFKSWRLDLFASIMIWGVACFFWLNQIPSPSYNSLELTPPNYQSYPFGDALLYDVTAHEFLIGKPFPSDFSIKPLFSLFLVVMHIFAGEDYDLLLAIQVGILSSIPVIVYLLTRRISDPPTGLVTALLVIFREQNGIALSNVIQVSHAKLLMSEVFTSGLLALLMLMIFTRIQSPKNISLTIGGCLGALVLTRVNAIVLLPITVFIIACMPVMNEKYRWKNIILFSLGMAVMLIPWMGHNYITGENNTSQSSVSSYGVFTAELYDLILRDPGQITGTTVSHFFHNSIFSYIYLPQSFHIEEVRRYVLNEPFWQFWTGFFQGRHWLMLGLNVILITLGFGSLWRKNKINAIIPLLLGIGYNIGVSVSGFSGWRFIQPADWITLIYYSVGLIQLVYIIEFIVTQKSNQHVLVESHQAGRNFVFADWKGWSKTLLPFLLISGMLVVGQKLFINRLQVFSNDELIEEFRANIQRDNNFFHETSIKRFLSDDHAVIISGQGLYPSFWGAGSGYINHFWRGYSPKPFSRLGFYLLGEQSSYILLPMGLPPLSFPSGSNVIVMGCENQDEFIDAVAVLLQTDPPILYLREPFPDFHCPIHTP